MILAIADIIISICVLALFISILINFAESKKEPVQKEKKSVVATGSMTLFFLVFYFILRLGLGVINASVTVTLLCAITGLLIIVLGCCVNIFGRFNLGSNWANQVRIYKNQTLVTKGVYRLVRHPLYASTIWMFYGACLVYLDYYAALVTTLIFVPFMYYRARQEEDLLAKTFKEYNKYRKEVGMFFPKFHHEKA